MGEAIADLPHGLAMRLDDPPPPALRSELARRINDFHSRTVPHEAKRFSLRVVAAEDALVGGLVGVIGWQWLFIEALWVDDSLRGQGVGRSLVQTAEAHALAAGCRSCWLDTFQARGFYEALGYQPFGQLDDYPLGQTRWFLRKALA